MPSRWCRIRNATCAATATACTWCRSCPSWPACAIRTTIGIIEKHAQRFRWNGEAQHRFPDYGGVLHFDAAQHGFDPAWLRAQPLEIDFRKGGEKLKLAPTARPAASRQWFQATGIPAWERTRLPIVSSGSDLLFAAGLGMDCRHLGEGPDRVALRWEASPKHFYAKAV
jgi:tRNA(Ile)-lysidine synthase